jgi:hypothetical protein
LEVGNVQGVGWIWCLVAIQRFAVESIIHSGSGRPAGREFTVILVSRKGHLTPLAEDLDWHACLLYKIRVQSIETGLTKNLPASPIHGTFRDSIYRTNGRASVQHKSHDRKFRLHNVSDALRHGGGNSVAPQALTGVKIDSAIPLLDALRKHM